MGNERIKRIFVGGTGRSGTTILSKKIGSHREVERIGESRFIIDKNGLLDLWHSLTKNYSIDQGRVAIRSFKKMIYSMMTPYSTPYLFYRVLSRVDKRKVEQILDELCENLIEGSFIGWDYQTEIDRNLELWKKMLYSQFTGAAISGMPYRIRKGLLRFMQKKENRPKENIVVPRYFNTNEEDLLLSYLRLFTDRLFVEIAHKNNKIHWCEDTPANILNIHFLHKMFPNAYFIHVVRHPIGVAFSMRNQVWAPYDWPLITKMLKNLYRALIKTERWAISEEVNYRRVRLEDLAGKDNVFYEIIDYIGLSNNFEKDIKLEIEKVDYWKEKVSSNVYNYLQKELAAIIEYFGYEP